jgi:uncharacterized protein YdiU (UPF0061 family)
MRALENLNFENSYVRLPEAFHKRLEPTPLENPHLVSINEVAAELIDLDPAEAGRSEFIDYFNGASILPGAEPLAAIYAGHQFGHYVPQLGDGRAILLGEVRNSRNERWELQLKGAGLTPFSRQGDGRAVLRSTIREYLCSEAMHGLGIPTTRALCIIGSSEKVYRESVEHGAMLLRMAPSHLRFGSFELFYYRRQFEQLQQLAEYTLQYHYPHLLDETDRYFKLFQEVIGRTARLISQWQLVGFAHGVMNTDNMSLLGITIDYGPFGFLDAFDPGFICNHSDHSGRYAFDRQPDIALWNLSRLGQAMLPLFKGEAKAAAERANAELENYVTLFQRYNNAGMHRKLGLNNTLPQDGTLITDLLSILRTNIVDYTNFFRALGNLQVQQRSGDSTLRDMFIEREAFDHWAEDYRQRLRAEQSRDSVRKAAMDSVNPKYILRNYLAQVAIQRAAESRDYSEIDRLLALLRKPFDEQPEMERYAKLPPEWSKSIAISCSS